MKKLKLKMKFENVLNKKLESFEGSNLLKEINLKGFITDYSQSGECTERARSRSFITGFMKLDEALKLHKKLLTSTDKMIIIEGVDVRIPFSIMSDKVINDGWWTGDDNVNWIKTCGDKISFFIDKEKITFDDGVVQVICFDPVFCRNDLFNDILRCLD